jgi:hypothetical protein
VTTTRTHYCQSPMATYRSSVSIEASVHETFAFVRDVGNFPRFVDRLIAAQALGDDEVRVTLAEGDGQRTAQAQFKTHEGGHHSRVEWSADGGDHYHGWLEIDREGEVCSVTMELHAPEIDGAEVDAALWALKAAVEAR